MRWCRRPRDWRARRSATGVENWRRACRCRDAFVDRAPGGRPSRQIQPGLTEALVILIEPVTRGDPMSPLRWTCKSKAKLAGALTAQGWPVSASTVGRLLHGLGFRLHALQKAREGTAHPDRERAVRAHQRDGRHASCRRQQPVISVDTKKKELVGDFKNAGREWQPTGEPGARARARLPGRRRRQSDSVRRLRHGAERSVGQRRPRPRHAGLRGRVDPPVVDDDGAPGVPGRRRAVHHRRRGRQQRLSHARVEDRAATAGR